jgi:hypothetical protein
MPSLSSHPVVPSTSNSSAPVKGKAKAKVKHSVCCVDVHRYDDDIVEGWEESTIASRKRRQALNNPEIDALRKLLLLHKPIA